MHVSSDLFTAGTATADTIIKWCLLALLFYAAKIITLTLLTGVSHSMAYAILESLRLLLANRFLHAPLGNVENHSIGEIKNMMVDKIENLEPPLAHIIPEGVGHIALAAYTVGLLIESGKGGAAFDTSWIWKSIIIQILLVFFRFLFDYFRARLQEPISCQLTTRDRLAVGDALKRVSLGCSQQVSTGNILSSITTGLSTLENMGIRMIDNFVGGYLNFAVIFVYLAMFSPITALIALAAAVLSLCFMFLISRITVKKCADYYS